MEKHRNDALWNVLNQSEIIFLHTFLGPFNIYNRFRCFEIASKFGNITFEDEEACIEKVDIPKG